MRNPQKQETRAGGPGLPKDEKLLLLDKSFLPVSVPVVNTSSPKLWRALRQFDRNLKKIIRLREKNQVLLEEMRRLQRVAS
jgi:hypothetical protein